ncbi:MAG: cytochrome c oxidase accessory protein CcoG [Deltaproteobacteria bacterium]|nr:cytochrome c oxidase accessory protein CcoG [Deltaproteobacteria bacterium]
MRPPAPTLDRLAILDDEGRRRKIHPADVDGKWARRKPLVRWLLIAVIIVLPWLEVGGHPAVLFDLPARRYYLFGSVFGTGDLPFLFFVFMAGAWGLVVVTALFGRVWCGWACPQTVTLEGIFRRIERAIEGSGHQRLAFDLAPWTAAKLFKKLLKWTLFLLCSFVIAHVWLSYFVSLPRVVTMVLDDPHENWTAFLIAAFATGITWFNFAWFREQTCLIICPYGRLQSALQDKDSIVVGYDTARGEPRGAVKEHSGGDCVDCRRCVQVCPTGIDIRNGLQMECIGCAGCADACDDVMAKLHRPLGLIRYESERAMGGAPRRILRPRIAAYAVAGLALAAAAIAFAVARAPLLVRVVRVPGPLFVIVDGGATVQNTVLLHVENRSSEDIVVSAAGDVDITLPMGSRALGPQERADLPLIVRVPRHRAAGQKAHVVVKDDRGHAVDVAVTLFGPAP